MKIAQILVAAGKGARLGGDLPKQYLPLGRKTVIAHTLDSSYRSGIFDQIVVVIAPGDQVIHSIIDNYDPAPLLVEGGATRTDSVKAGLNALTSTPPDFILIHDAARPFATPKLMTSLIEALADSDAAVPVLPVVDAIKSFQSGDIGEDLDRSALRAIQTPQAFKFAKIMSAFENLSPNASYADDIAIAREAGLKIKTVDGETSNFKITYPDDLKRAQNMIENNRRYTACGQGYDVHRVEPGDSLWLCGVEIPAGFSLKGHSDADVGLHALTDALLGALAEGDIGDHFPPSDPKWSGAPSDQFLAFARDKVSSRHGRINNVDITLVCEKPKIKPYRAAMKMKVAEILRIPDSRVSIKATTTEKLGFTGRAEGIAAFAAANVELPDD